MKLIISTIVVGVLLFLLGWLFYGMLFMDFFKANFENYDNLMKKDMILWALIVGSLVQAFLLAWIYPIGYKGGSPTKEGLMYGIYMGLFLALPMIFYTIGEMRITKKGAAVDGLIEFVMILLAGLVTGWIYGKKATPPSS